MQLFRIIETLYSIRDLDSLLERVLTEARQFVEADAGTIYLAARGYLYLSYVQNDTLFQGETKDKDIPSGAALPIDKTSLVGYVAETGETILIDDVRHIQSDVSYSFNPAVDEKTNYRTLSILCVPLKTRDNEIVGVLQLINAKNDKGEVVAFSVQDEQFITQFALIAADAVERERLSREMVLRMIDLAALRDPYEGGGHTVRVGAYSVELYEKWATRRGISLREIRKVNEALRPAAMLHDIGNIAVSDLILKKPGELTYEETLIMREHTVLGARLFTRTGSFLDSMSADVALNHHENWDGSGYPGQIENLLAKKIYMGPGKRGNEIPLYARIVTVADVYDALVSQRAYRAGWPQERALRFLRYQAGKKFDPEMVSIFLTMDELLLAIAKKYEY